MNVNLSDTEKRIFDHSIECLKIQKISEDDIRTILENIYELAYAIGQLNGINQASDLFHKS